VAEAEVDGLNDRAGTVFIVGHARLPGGMAARSMFETLALTVEIEPRDAVILAASVTLVTDLGRDFVARLLVGRSLRHDAEAIVASIRARYRGAGQAALLAAFKDLYREYQAWAEGRPVTGDP
jgi:predicted methyltransferase